MRPLAWMHRNQEKRQMAAKFIPDRGVAERYSVGRGTVWKWAAERRDGFPRPHKLGHRITRWSVDELDEFDAKLADKGART